MTRQFTLSKQLTYIQDGKTYDLSGNEVIFKRTDEDCEQDCVLLQNDKYISPCSFCKFGFMGKDSCKGNCACLAFGRYVEELENAYENG